MNNFAVYKTTSYWNWVGSLILFNIPVLGLILLVVWSFKGKDQSKKNFCRATLTVGILLSVLFWGLSAICYFLVPGLAESIAKAYADFIASMPK